MVDVLIVRMLEISYGTTVLSSNDYVLLSSNSNDNWNLVRSACPYLTQKWAYFLNTCYCKTFRNVSWNKTMLGYSKSRSSVGWTDWQVRFKLVLLLYVLSHEFPCPLLPTAASSANRVVFCLSVKVPVVILIILNRTSSSKPHQQAACVSSSFP
jgi:hypothetical protein